MASSRGMTAVVEADRNDEVWIRGANPEQAIRVRSLTKLRGNGVSLLEVRLVERLDETWIVYVRLSDRDGEFRVNLAKSDEPRAWRDVALALASVRDELDFWGAIVCSTERRRPNPA
ncbi:MAG TPA: hypothetical protein VE309_05025 [Caulobacteraceae bacterium]|nr:hypothetical protein [Caulobacteraceae bacterium]